MPDHDLARNAAAFRRALLAWYRAERRDLPWRSEPSLYATVVSEFMLQQTQVKTVVPYFHRWMRRFPDFQALARAPAQEVLRHWEGLGYYRRAHNIHRLAKAYLDLPSAPSTPDAWRALPGIGPYTAAAIASIAQGHPAAVVDGNVVRILARLTDDRSTFAGNAEAVRAFSETAASLLQRSVPGEHNQAMMELGATVCLKRAPRCHACPVRRFCRADASGDPAALPQIRRKATVRIEVHRAWILHRRKLLLHRIPDHATQLAGQYELPALETLGLPIPDADPILTRSRSITHRRIKERIHPFQPPPPAIPDSPQLHWIPLAKLNTLTLSGPHRRWIGELLAPRHNPPPK